MNALVTMEAILEPAPGSLLSAETIFGSGQAETIVAAIEAQVRAEIFDITTEDGRERVKSVAYKIARSKTTMDDIGKDHVAHIKAQSAKIDKERKSLRDRLDALKEEVRGPLTAWEDAEADRIDTHEHALVTIAQGHIFSFPPTSAEIMERQAELSRVADRDWQEFRERADEAYQAAFPRLEEMRAAAEQAEADAAELAELRKLKAEREEADRKAAEVAAAAEQARLIEEARAAREEQEAEAAAERERRRAEQAKRDQETAVARALEKAARDAEDTAILLAQEQAARDAEAKRAIAKAEADAARAVEQERERAARAKADEERAAAKREANTRHRNKVHREILTALCSRGFAEIEANNVVSWLSGGEIPHVSITY